MLKNLLVTDRHKKNAWGVFSKNIWEGAKDASDEMKI